MSKVVVISGEANITKPPTVSVVTDWNKCALCQTKTTDKIQCPTKSTRAHYISAYATFSENLSTFIELGNIPLNINPGRLDDGVEVLQSLENQQAWWHKKCYIQFD